MCYSNGLGEEMLLEMSAIGESEESSRRASAITIRRLVRAVAVLRRGERVSERRSGRRKRGDGGRDTLRTWAERARGVTGAPASGERRQRQTKLSGGGRFAFSRARTDGVGFGSDNCLSS